MEPGDWKCSCGWSNFKKRTLCKNCGKDKPTNIELHPGDKNCTICNDINFASRTTCRKCGHILSSDNARYNFFNGVADLFNPSSSTTTSTTSSTSNSSNLINQNEQKIIHPSGEWICTNDSCKEHNFASRMSCRKCHTVKTSVEVTSLYRPGDWICTNNLCNKHNFASRTSCHKCNAPRSSPNSELTTTNTQSVKPSDSPEDICVVCMTKPKTHVLLKCRHLCLCDICGFALNKCPICRESYNPDTDLFKIINC